MHRVVQRSVEPHRIRFKPKRLEAQWLVEPNRGAVIKVDAQVKTAQSKRAVGQGNGRQDQTPTNAFALWKVRLRTCPSCDLGKRACACFCSATSARRSAR